MSKIFQIGFGKCGTTSIYDLFKDSGIKSTHWDMGNVAKKIYYNMHNGISLLNGYDDYICFTDMQYLIHEMHIEIYKISIAAKQKI